MVELQGGENSRPGACSPDHQQTILFILSIDVNQESTHARRRDPTPAIVGCGSVSFPDNPHKLSIPLQPLSFNLLNRFSVTRTQVCFRLGPRPPRRGGSSEGETSERLRPAKPVPQAARTAQSGTRQQTLPPADGRQSHWRVQGRYPFRRAAGGGTSGVSDGSFPHWLSVRGWRLHQTPDLGDPVPMGEDPLQRPWIDRMGRIRPLAARQAIASPVSGFAGLGWIVGIPP